MTQNDFDYPYTRWGQVFIVTLTNSSQNNSFTHFIYIIQEYKTFSWVYFES